MQFESKCISDVNPDRSDILSIQKSSEFQQFSRFGEVESQNHHPPQETNVMRRDCNQLYVWVQTEFDVCEPIFSEPCRRLCKLIVSRRTAADSPVRREET
jgi:hypothetical protein